jgi:hypothetical protein
MPGKPDGMVSTLLFPPHLAPLAHLLPSAGFSGSMWDSELGGIGHLPDGRASPGRLLARLPKCIWRLSILDSMTDFIHILIVRMKSTEKRMP